MNRKLLALLGGVALASPAWAFDYPTMDRVDQVLTCMKENGGQTIDNLQRCSCQMDVIMQTVNFDDFNEARTYEIYKQMPGEKGGMFRDSERGSELTKRLGEARADARKRCFVGAVRQTTLPAQVPGKKIVAPQ